jgi:hypothetical protein
MPLTREDRIELLKRAREAKANKKAIKEEETEDEEDPVVNVTIPEAEPLIKKKTGRKPKIVVELPIPVEVIQIEEPVSKKKILPAKWLKQIKSKPETACCNNEVTKEDYIIDDEKPQVIEEKIVVPPQKEIKKVRKVRASTPAKTLDLTEKPRDITDVIEELTEDNSKYIPKVVKQSSAPISIVHQKLRLFDY